jgi:nitronate monooxygenase
VSDERATASAGAGGSAVLDALAVPVVLAPLAGGPASVELAAAVGAAGALGFLAAGYRTCAQMAGQIAELRGRGCTAFGVNLFVPPARPAPPGRYADYAERLRQDATAAGVALGPPRSDDDDWQAKLDHLAADPVPVVSFAFGCPAAPVIDRLRRAGSEVWVTVTTPQEAELAAVAGADALVAQGAEAGGHSSTFADGGGPADGLGLLALLQLLARPSLPPRIAAGAVSSGRGLAAVLAAGARAAQVGSAFLLCPEAGTADVHREAVRRGGPTAVTRAFTGKPARGIVNRFMEDHPSAPAAFPEIHHMTAPLRAAGREAMDPGLVNLWAGQAHPLARPAPAAVVVRDLWDEAQAALRAACERHT